MTRMDDGSSQTPPPTLLPPTVGEELVVDRDVLHDVARTLQNDLQELHDAAGSPSRLNHEGLVTAAELGHYPAGEQIAVTCKNAHQFIGRAYDTFVRSYQDVIDAIKSTADGYDNAENATTDAVNRQGGGASPTTYRAGSAG